MTSSRGVTARTAMMLGTCVVDPALRSLNERIERADDVVAIQTDVGREVLPAVGGWHRVVTRTCSRDVHRSSRPHHRAGAQRAWEENSMKAPQKPNNPFELHATDTLDWDPLAELCPGST